MLAEVRKYGESLIIVDQIPNKLTPEVLKNTNTKIVHRIFAQDDKEAIGNTMALKDEQKEHLSYLETGRAIMMAPRWSKAVQVQIAMNSDNDTERMPTDDEDLRKRILKYYASIYKKGIFCGLENFTQPPSTDIIELYLSYFQDGSFGKLYKCAVRQRDVSERFVKKVNELLSIIDKKVLAHTIALLCYEKKEDYKSIEANIGKLLDEIHQVGTNVKISSYDDALCNCKCSL
jgi:hypothetical protein